MRGIEKYRFPRIDTKATARNTDKLLQEYPSYLAIAHRSFIRSQRLSGMPSGSFDPSTADHVIIDTIDATQFVIDARHALATVRERDGSGWYKVLEWLYFTQHKTAQSIMEQSQWSKSAYYDNKRWALCAFAETFPRFWGKLVVYQNGGDRHE